MRRYRRTMQAARFLLIAACLVVTNCAGTITPPSTSPVAPAREALLVLPGFGYSAGGERAIKALAPVMRAEGLDLYVPRFIRRSGLDDSREHLRRFVREQRLDRYQRVHVFAFLAGGWTFNALVEDETLLPNIASIVYDRSPYQERAPRIAADKLRVLSWLRYGPVLFDFAKAPYRPLPRTDIKVGLIVETVPTGFVKRFGKTARSYGPFAFECQTFKQPYDDCIFVAVNHNQLYPRFGEIWPELHAFIRDGRFSAAADRNAPTRDVLAASKRERPQEVQ